jgi:membrane associated rhomboid family serine protease
VIRAKPRRAPRFPIATVVTTILTVLGAVAQIRDPRVLEAWRRNPEAMYAGQWWRVFTPLLVQSEGWGQIFFNIASLAVVGWLAERRLGTLRWLVLYLVVGLVSEVAGYSLDSTGAGNSLAVCGLAGGLAAVLLTRPGRASRPEIFVVPYYVACLVGLALGAAAGATIASGLTIAVFVVLLRSVERPTVVAVFAGVLAIGGAAVLAYLRNNHGFSLLGGALLGWLLSYRVDPGPGRTELMQTRR